MARSQDLRVQIAGDATKLLAAVDSAERKLGSLGTTSSTVSAKIAAANLRMDDSVAATARAQEAATAKIRASQDALIASSEKTGGALQTIHKHALAGGLALTGLFGGYQGARSAIADTIELAKSTALLSKNTGTSVEQSSRLVAVTQALGLDQGQLAMGIRGLSKATEAQIAGTAKSATAFDKLGISQQEAQAHAGDTAGMLELVATRLQGVAGGTEKVTLLNQLFGRAWQNINPLIRDGGAALADNLAVADKYGVTLSTSTLPKLLELAKAEREHKLAMLGLKVAFTDLAGGPMITAEHRIASVLNDIRSGNWADLTAQTKSLGDGLSKAIEAVTPKVADAFAAAGPKIVLGLIKGFSQAGLSGEILMGVLLVKKFGLLSAFTTAGIDAAKAFALKFGIGAEASAAVEGAAAGKTFGVAFDAAAAEGVAAGAAEGGVIMTAIVAAGPALAAALGLAIGSKLAGSITGGGLTAPAGEGIGGGKYAGGKTLSQLYPNQGTPTPGKGKFGSFATGSLQYEGLDQGVDFTGTGSLLAPADIKITRVDRHSGWPGGTLIAGQITSGANKGRYVYFAEALSPGKGVAVGNTIAAGSEIAALSSSYPGSESGFAQNASGQAYGSPSEGKNGANPDPQAIAFADFLAGTHSRGAATGAGGSGSGKGLASTGASGGNFRTVGASMYGGPSDPSSGTTGYKGDNLDSGPLAFAELGMGHNLGGLAYGAGLVISYKGRAVTAYKLDIGAGGAAVQGHRRDIDLYYRTAAALGFPNGLDLVQIRPVGSTKGTAKTDAQTQAADMSAYQAATSDVQLELQAGAITSRQAQATLRALGNKALSGGFGSLDSHSLLQVRADLAGAAPSGSDLLFGLESKAQRGALRSQRGIATAQAKLVAQFAAQIAPFTANQQRIESAQNLIPTDLSTARGAMRAVGDLQERKGAQQHIKQIYESELAAIQKEVAAWVVSRDTYRKLARKAKGAAKKQALDRAAGLQAMIDQANADAQTVGGNIADAAIQIQSLDDQIAQTQADATTQQQGRAMADYQQAISDVQLQADAGLMTQADADAKKQQIGKAALAISATFGTLSQRDQWQIMADLNNATQANTSALQANTQAQLDATNVQLKYAQAAEKIANLSTGVAVKALADLVSGQITGVDYAGRKMSAGSGAAANY